MFPTSSILDTTYLQLIEYSTDEMLKLNHVHKNAAVQLVYQPCYIF